jgi:hypothetical protein
MMLFNEVSACVVEHAGQSQTQSQSFPAILQPELCTAHRYIKKRDTSAYLTVSDRLNCKLQPQVSGI